MRKRVLTLLLSLCLVASLLPVGALAADFTDVASDHWAKEAIDRWSDYGIVSGDTAGTFRPGDSIKTSEAAKIFSELMKLSSTEGAIDFADVAEDAWYAEYFAKCSAAGIINGVGNNEDGQPMAAPDSQINRERFFVMFARTIGLAQEDSSDNELTKNPDISDWAQGWINALVNKGFVKGTTGENGEATLAPKVDINRASVMSLLDQTISAYATADEPEVTADGGLALVVAGGTTVKGEASDLVVAAAAAKGTVTLDGATIDSLIVDAEGATIVVKEGATVKDAAINAENVTLNGDGKVESAYANANNAKIDTKDTAVTVAEGVTGTTQNGAPVTSTATTPVAPNGTTVVSGGSSGGGGGGSTTRHPADAATLDATLNFTKTIDGVGSRSVVAAVGDITLDEGVVDGSVRLADRDNLSASSILDLLTLNSRLTRSDVTVSAILVDKTGENDPWAYLNANGTFRYSIPSDATAAQFLTYQIRVTPSNTNAFSEVTFTVNIYVGAVTKVVAKTVDQIAEMTNIVEGGTVTEATKAEVGQAVQEALQTIADADRESERTANQIQAQAAAKVEDTQALEEQFSNIGVEAEKVTEDVKAAVSTVEVQSVTTSAKVEEVPVLDADGNQVVDGDGNPVVKPVVKTLVSEVKVDTSTAAGSSAAAQQGKSEEGSGVVLAATMASSVADQLNAPSSTNESLKQGILQSKGGALNPDEEIQPADVINFLKGDSVDTSIVDKTTGQSLKLGDLRNASIDDLAKYDFSFVYNTSNSLNPNDPNQQFNFSFG